MSRYRSQVREVINRNTVVSLALEQGYNVFLPVYDGGVDFILHRESDGELRKVQLKGRWTIDKKYEERAIWIAFPIAGEWYMAPHDEMVESAVADGATQTDSWKIHGIYSRPRPSKNLIASLARYRFAPIGTVAAVAAEEAEEAADGVAG